MEYETYDSKIEEKTMQLSLCLREVHDYLVNVVDLRNLNEVFAYVAVEKYSEIKHCKQSYFIFLDSDNIRLIDVMYRMKKSIRDYNKLAVPKDRVIQPINKYSTK
jgi:hypothetical protein